MRNGNLLKSLLIWLLIGLGLMMIFNKFNDTKDTKNTIPYSQFITDLEGGQVKNVVIEGNSMQSQWVNGVRKDDSKFTTF